jgi:hypothetical protein
MTQGLGQAPSQSERTHPRVSKALPPTPPRHEGSFGRMEDQFIPSDVKFHSASLEIGGEEVLVGTELAGWLARNCQSKKSVVVLPDKPPRRFPGLSVNVALRQEFAAPPYDDDRARGSALCSMPGRKCSGARFSRTALASRSMNTALRNSSS